MTMHKLMAETMDKCVEEIKEIQRKAREEGILTRPMWPMIVLQTPKGWTGPKVVDGNKIEGTFRAHQVPISMEKPEHVGLLEQWLKSYKPEELFDEDGQLEGTIPYTATQDGVLTAQFGYAEKAGIDFWISCKSIKTP